MGSEVTTFRLESLLDITSSKRIHAIDYVPHGIPFYRGKEIIEKAKGNRISTELFITSQKFNEIKQKFDVPKNGDILLTSVGTLGVPYFIQDDGNFYFKDGNVTWFRNFSNLINSKYLYYWLIAPSTQQQLDKISIGSTQKALTISALKSLQITLPTIHTQKEIVYTLDLISNRLTLLRETNATLEAIAQALFKSWFVDFDPVRAKAEGRQPEGMDAETAALFPDSFEESGLGLAPKGWKEPQLSSLFNIIGGGTPKTSNPEYWNGDIPWFSVIDAPSESDVFVLNTAKTITQKGVDDSSTNILSPGVTIISARGTVGKLALVGRPMAINQSCYGLSPVAGIGPSFLYFMVKKAITQLRLHAHGSVFDTLTRNTFTSISVIRPSGSAINGYERIVWPVLEKIKESLKEIQVLSEIRDALLPKLISGKIHICGSKKLAEIIK
jgi:type I restriction enzyme S subunit